MLGLLKIDATCNILQIGKTKLYGLVNAGDLDLHKVGRGSRISVESLDRFIAVSKQGDRK